MAGLTASRADPWNRDGGRCRSSNGGRRWRQTPAQQRKRLRPCDALLPVSHGAGVPRLPRSPNDAIAFALVIYSLPRNDLVLHHLLAGMHPISNRSVSHDYVHSHPSTSKV